MISCFKLKNLVLYLKRVKELGKSLSGLGVNGVSNPCQYSLIRSVFPTARAARPAAGYTGRVLVSCPFCPLSGFLQGTRLGATPDQQAGGGQPGTAQCQKWGLLWGVDALRPSQWGALSVVFSLSKAALLRLGLVLRLHVGGA